MVLLCLCRLGFVLSCVWIGSFDMVSCLVVSAMPATVEVLVLRSCLTKELCLCPVTQAPSITHCRGRCILVALAQRLNLLGKGLGCPLRPADLLGGGLYRVSKKKLI
jgi:hypothetical protein